MKTENCKIHGSFTYFDDNQQMNVCTSCGNPVTPAPTETQSTADRWDNISGVVIDRIKKQLDLIPDDPTPSERSAYDAYLNCLNWVESLNPKTP